MLVYSVKQEILIQNMQISGKYLGEKYTDIHTPWLPEWPHPKGCGHYKISFYSNVRYPSRTNTLIHNLEYWFRLNYYKMENVK